MATTTEGMDADTLRLHQLGYAQELNRGMGWFSNFAVSFTIISILTGGITTYYLGMDAGGPVAIIWGWLLVGGLVTLVGLAMAEVCSSYPTAGGLYYWAAQMAPPGKAAVWSWFTGWFNLLGQVAVTASIDFGLANFVAFFIKLFHSSFPATPRVILLIYGILLALHALVNSFGVGLTALLSNVSVWWHLVGTVLVVGALFIVPSDHASFSFVFTKYVNDTGWTFTGNALWVIAIGLMLAQYTMTGYDASAHMTEETRNAAMAGPKGIMTSIWVSIAAGFVLMLGLTFALPMDDKGYGVIAGKGTFAAGQVILNSMGPNLAKFLIFVIVIAQFFCGMASVTANSRMIYAFSRDGAVPGHRLWHRINARTRTPTNAIWFAAIFAFILGIPSLKTSNGVPIAFFAIVSVAVVGLYISYVMPVFLRRINSRNFTPGPWNLGRGSAVIGWVSVVWVILICFPLLLPQFSPITATSFNYAPVAVLAVIGFAGLYWVLSARKWFTGPKIQGSAEEIAEIERDLTI
jgi:amino acid permease (GABA permease)